MLSWTQAHFRGEPENMVSTAALGKEIKALGIPRWEELFSLHALLYYLLVSSI